MKTEQTVFQNQTEHAVFLKTEPNLKNPFRTSLVLYTSLKMVVLPMILMVS